MFNGSMVWAVLPALDEEQSIGLVINALKSTTLGDDSKLVDRIIVCDNGSIDETASVAEASGAEVVFESERGYGAACLKALAHFDKQSQGNDLDHIIVFVDADHSVRIDELPSLILPIANDADLVIGNRTAGSRQWGALTPQQRFGNWLATTLIRRLWAVEVNDLGPFRAIRADALESLNLQDRAFGWTCEMQIRAIQEGLNIVEVPVSSTKRIGKSKISGTLMGTLRAGKGILGTLATLWLKERRHRGSSPSNASSLPS